MAKVTGVASQLSGKVGQLIYRQTKYGTVVYEARRVSVPQRSEAQMKLRTQWSNLAAVYRQFNQTLKKGFEGLKPNMNEYNAFIQANTNVVKVYVPKSVRMNGGSVLAPYQITRGTLPSIAMSVGSDGVLKSDLQLGTLQIGAATTVADLANAVIAYNEGYEEGDQITFFYGKQTTDNVTGIPRARIYGYKVMLNPEDSTLLYEVVSALGFTSVQGEGSVGYVLGMNAAITDAAAVWVHSQENGTNGLKVSTQYLYVDSSLLAGYQTESAMAGAANSYGGINTGAVYLKPTGNVGSGAGAGEAGSEASQGNGGSGSGSSGSQGGSSSAEGTGGTGGSGTGGAGTEGTGTEGSGGDGTEGSGDGDLPANGEN